MTTKIERRTLLKAAAGGALAAGASLGCSLERSSEKGGPLPRPWWSNPAEEPVLAIDDATYGRFNQDDNVLRAMTRYVGEERMKELETGQADLLEKFGEDGVPGYRIEDQALERAGWLWRGKGGLDHKFDEWIPRETPTKRWQGSPQDAAKIIKRAARFYGACDAGIAPLDVRHIYSRSYGKEIVFADVPVPQIDEETATIPTSCKYAIALVVRMSPELSSRAPSQLCDATTSIGYSRLEFTAATLAEFIRNLGYIAIPSVNGLGSSIALAVEAGLGELGRTNRFISPIYGPCVQLGKILTDMPLATDKPISFGLKEFCRVCGRCAESCPSKAISTKTDPDFVPLGPYSNPGHEAWFEDSVKCYEYWYQSGSYCSVCYMVCPWAKQDKTAIHEIVKASSTKIPALDRLFISMDQRFGYGQQKDPDAWWDLDLNEFGIDRILR